MAGQKNDRKKQSLRASERDMLPVQNRIKLNPTVILFAFVFVFLIVSPIFFILWIVDFVLVKVFVFDKNITERLSEISAQEVRDHIYQHGVPGISPHPVQQS